MTTNLESHDYPVDKLSSDLNRQTAFAFVNGSSLANKICNIPRYSYKGTKVAVQYTYKTITAHPIIASVTLVEGVALTILMVAATPIFRVAIASALSFAAATVCYHKLSKNKESAPTNEESDSTLTSSRLMANLALVASMISMVIVIVSAALCNHQSTPIIAASKLTAAAGATVAAALVAGLAYIPYKYGYNHNEEK